ncbi:FAD-dependent oxidoreductase [Streptomyces sp. DSM 44915]|uniref:FAD-dependent oxidoreductase n=1 Tax=Streptomyces chisholmiae TaxID=3075540 RepID=A0ABU2JIZ0_9ACTN|nr:FAD-dependent oxidoreductase [Streptomyces sp. DSM 44915]MDT0264957.1 FAD-dependent oxidoreductase [Streptomyces sp. DSM 44915]
MTGGRIVIVGAGLAGANTALALRERGWRGPLTLLGAEPYRPYDRPPLSKEVLLGQPAEVDLDIDFEAHDIELALGRTATRLDVRARRLATDGGPLDYASVVLACGAVAVDLPGTAGLPHVHTLRTRDDAERLRPVLAAAGSLVIVGAGWIGAEVATAARAAGCAVTVVEAGPHPLAGTLPAEVAERLAAWYAAAGVRLRTGVAVTAVREGEVELADGTVLGAEAVLVGIGSRPDTDWLAGSGVPLDGSGAVLADARLATEAPGVYAVGDCASYPSARFGRRLLTHHWQNALDGAGTVAATLLGEPVSHDPVPYFWSRQFGRYLQYAGHHRPDDRLVWRVPDGAQDGPWSVCWTRDGRLTAVLAVDRPRDLLQGRRLVDRLAEVDPARLADPDVPLKSAAR